jgi:GT2 family glycosyltransferase
MSRASKTRAARSKWRQTLHELNRRYQEAWNRAERLQDELDQIKKSRSYRLLTWWRWFVGRWRAPPAAGAAPAFVVENLESCKRPPTGSVAIVIPFKDHVDMLANCLRSIRRASHRISEVILLDNGSSCPRTLRCLERLRRRPAFKVVACPGPFNFARLCNLGARQADADFLLFLNNDTEVLSLDWLNQLLTLANSPGIGIVGATLLYPDDTLQHAGIFPTKDGQWAHVYRGQPANYPGDDGELAHARSVPAVTGACLMIRRQLFMEMSGFDERYPVTFNDVDLCCRVRRRGLKVAITPHARLFHFESISRGFSRT